MFKLVEVRVQKETFTTVPMMHLTNIFISNDKGKGHLLHLFICQTVFENPEPEKMTSLLCRNAPRLNCHSCAPVWMMTGAGPLMDLSSLLRFRKTN